MARLDGAGEGQGGVAQHQAVSTWRDMFDSIGWQEDVTAFLRHQSIIMHLVLSVMHFLTPNSDALQLHP